jgi:hypothetical protein
MGFLGEMDDDLVEIEDDLGEMEDGGKRLFSWGGLDYPCSPTSLSASTAVVLGGFNLNVTQAITVRLRSNGSDDQAWNWAGGGGPQDGDAIAYENAGYQVVSRRIVHDRFMVLGLGDEDA